jgi:hypothetical protein
VIYDHDAKTGKLTPTGQVMTDTHRGVYPVHADRLKEQGPWLSIPPATRRGLLLPDISQRRASTEHYCPELGHIAERREVQPVQLNADVRKWWAIGIEPVSTRWVCKSPNR